MRFLLDVNADGALARHLAALGHDVVAVRTRDPRLPDLEILGWANQEQRIIITTDSDFEVLVWQRRLPHHGILRLENLPRSARLALCDEALRRFSEPLAQGAIVIADTMKFRVRTW